MRHSIVIPAAALAVVILFAATVAHAEDPCPAKPAYDQLHQRMDGLRDALSKRFGSGWTVSKLPAQLAEQVDHLQTAERDLAGQSEKLTERWDDCVTQTKQLDFDNRDLESKLKDIDRGEEQLKPQDEDTNKRSLALSQESTRHNMSMPSPDDKSGMVRWNAEAEDGNRRIKEVEKDQERLKQEHEEFAQRRNALFANVSILASKSNILSRRRTVLMQDLVPMITQARRYTMQATALTELPASGIEFSQASKGVAYQDFSKADKEVAAAIAQEASLQVLKRAVVASEGPGIAVAATDLIADVPTAGIDARTNEVERNLLLIGDYANVLKRMKEGGTLKPDDPKYQAIRQILTEQKESLPGSNAEIILQGLGTSQAMVAGMSKIVAAAASHYVSEKVSPAGANVVKHLSNIDRETIGKGLVNFFSNCLSGTAEAGAATITDTLFKQSSEKVSDQLYGPPTEGRHHNE